MVLVLRQVTKSQRTSPYEGRKRAYLKPTCPRRISQKAWREEHLSRCLKHTTRLFLDYVYCSLNCLLFCTVCLRDMVREQAQGFPLLTPTVQFGMVSTTRQTDQVLWDLRGRSHYFQLGLSRNVCVCFVIVVFCLRMFYWKGYIWTRPWIGPVGTSEDTRKSFTDGETSVRYSDGSAK